MEDVEVAQPPTVFSLDQVKQKAQELMKEKRMSQASTDSLDESSVPKTSIGDDFYDTSVVADDEDTTEAPTPTPSISETSVPAIKVFEGLGGGAPSPLWLVAERTLTPLWEVANAKSPLPNAPVTFPTSRSASETSGNFTRTASPPHLTLGDFNKMLNDSKNLQLPHVVKLATDDESTATSDSDNKIPPPIIVDKVERPNTLTIPVVTSVSPMRISPTPSGKPPTPQVPSPSTLTPSSELPPAVPPPPPLRPEFPSSGCERRTNSNFDELQELALCLEGNEPVNNIDTPLNAELLSEINDRIRFIPEPVRSVDDMRQEMSKMKKDLNDLKSNISEARNEFVAKKQPIMVRFRS